MKTCLNCKAEISETFMHCPICGARVCDKVNAVLPVYPTYKKNSTKLNKIRKWSSAFFFIATVSAVIINIIVGGSLWCAYVVLSSYLCNKIFLCEELIDGSQLKKLASVVCTICVFILIINFITGGSAFLAQFWLYSVVVLIISLFSWLTLYLYNFQGKKFNLWAEIKKKACIN